MYKHIRFIFILLFAGLFINQCDIISSISDASDDDDTYSFNASVSPSEAGFVDPNSGSFKDGETVSVEANIANTAWSFNNWTGDQQSTDNPLEFTINSDTEITANFDNVGSIYELDMQMADSLNSMSLVIGQAEGATRGFDSGMDHESPPPPPDSSSLHGFFKTDDLELLKDYRKVVTNSVSWNLQVRIGSGDSLSVSWNIDDTVLKGSLMLKNADGSKSVDMTANNSADFSESEADSLMIEYQL